MTPINAIGKVRFSSAKAQRVHLVEAEDLVADMLCLEKGQEVSPGRHPVVVYVIAGMAAVTCDGVQTPLPTGHVVCLDGKCTLRNMGEQRLICLAVRASK